MIARAVIGNIGQVDDRHRYAGVLWHDWEPSTVRDVTALHVRDDGLWALLSTITAGAATNSDGVTVAAGVRARLYQALEGPWRRG